MKTHELRRALQLVAQLEEALMTSAICVKEIRAELDLHDSLERGFSDLQGRGRNCPEARMKTPRPFLDQSTLSVSWRGKSLHLGHTRAFWLLSRLSRRPNQYVTHLDLLHDVWDDEELEVATIRSAVRHLRRRLRDGDMSELAEAIRGHNGHYILEL
jgi:DNA-binding response OmpR family regulator